MAIEGITSGMSTSISAQTSVKTTTVPETKDVTVQPDRQAVASVSAAVISKAGYNSDAMTENGEGSEEKKQPSERQIKQTVSDINRKLNNNTIAEFGFHDATNRVTIKIVDKDTKEVIREIPPEKTLDLIAKAWELAGILVDEKR